MVDVTDKKVAIPSAIIVLILSVLGTMTLTPNELDNIYVGYNGEELTCGPQYCHKLSNVNDDNLQINCYYNDTEPRRYKRCNDGWVRFDIKDIPKDDNETLKVIGTSDKEKVYKIVKEQSKTYYKRWKNIEDGTDEILTIDYSSIASYDKSK